MGRKKAVKAAIRNGSTAEKVRRKRKERPNSMEKGQKAV
jgi:hypothetical protein